MKHLLYANRLFDPRYQHHTWFGYSIQLFQESFSISLLETVLWIVVRNNNIKYTYVTTGPSRSQTALLLEYYMGIGVVNNNNNC